MPQELLAATTSAAASDDFGVEPETNKIPATFICTGLATTEKAQLQIHNGTTYVDLYVDGVLQEFSATVNAITAYGPGLYRVDKEASAGSVAVSVAYKHSL